MVNINKELLKNIQKFKTVTGIVESYSDEQDKSQESERAVRERKFTVGILFNEYLFDSEKQRDYVEKL